MREIKFRVWDGKEMKYDVTTDAIQDKINSCLCCISTINIEDFIKSLGEPLMQYTGQKDKNGKEIWEGDVVKFSRQNYHILWDDFVGGFSAQTQVRSDFHILGRPFSGKTEVIGNIWENPELRIINEQVNNS